MPVRVPSATHEPSWLNRTNWMPGRPRGESVCSAMPPPCRRRCCLLQPCVRATQTVHLGTLQVAHGRPPPRSRVPPAGLRPAPARPLSVGGHAASSQAVAASACLNVRSRAHLPQRLTRTVRLLVGWLVCRPACGKARFGETWLCSSQPAAEAVDGRTGGRAAACRRAAQRRRARRVCRCGKRAWRPGAHRGVTPGNRVLLLCALRCPVAGNTRVWKGGAPGSAERAWPELLGREKCEWRSHSGPWRLASRGAPSSTNVHQRRHVSVVERRAATGSVLTQASNDRPTAIAIPANLSNLLAADTAQLLGCGRGRSNARRSALTDEPYCFCGEVWARAHVAPYPRSVCGEDPRWASCMGYPTHARAHATWASHTCD
eukprot:365417-Chlamydomonas_euryale.AAC.12